MWLYIQATGELVSAAGEVVSTGYSGAGAGKNNPSMQEVIDVGPIPQGLYGIEAPIDSPIHGPYALPLVPDARNDMFGRAGFLIHGDSIDHPGFASEGCIIQPLAAREQVWDSGDHQLQVVSKIQDS